MSQRPFEELLSSAWKQRFGTREEAWLAGIRLRQGEPLWSRFQRHYERLIALPRRTRRRLQRRLAMSLAALALMLALSGAPAMGLQAASSVTGDVTLGSATSTARSGRAERSRLGLEHLVARLFCPARRAPPSWSTAMIPPPIALCPMPSWRPTATSGGNCDPGSGADVIDIQINVESRPPLRRHPYRNDAGGNGNTISGDGTFGPLLSVVASGDMTLNDVTDHGRQQRSGIRRRHLHRRCGGKDL